MPPMNIFARVLKNTTMLIASNVIVKVLGALLIIMLGRYLGDDAFGEYSFAFSFVAMFIIVSDFGLDALVIRNVARSNKMAGQYLEAAGILRIILSLVMIGIAMASAFILNLSSETRVIIFFAGLTGMFDKISGLFYAFFRAFERMEFEAATQIIWRVAQVGVGLAAMHLGYSLLDIVLLFLVMSLVRCIVAFSWLRLLDIRPEGERVGEGSLMRMALPFAAYEIGYSLYTNILIVMLFLITSRANEVGWFSAAYRILIFLLIIPTAFETAIYPVFSKLYKQRPAMMKLAYVKSMKFSLVVAIPVAFALSFLAVPLANMFGTGFDSASTAGILRVIGFGLPFLTLNMILKTLLWSSEETEATVRNIFGASLILATISGYLIYNVGYVGAAYGFIIGEIVLFALNFWYVSGHLYKVARVLWKPVIAGFAMSGITYGVFIFAEANIAYWHMLFIGLAAYLLAILSLKTFTIQDRNIILMSLGKFEPGRGPGR